MLTWDSMRADPEMRVFERWSKETEQRNEESKVDEGENPLRFLGPSWWLQQTSQFHLQLSQHRTGKLGGEAGHLPPTNWGFSINEWLHISRLYLPVFRWPLWLWEKREQKYSTAYTWGGILSEVHGTVHHIRWTKEMQ